MNKYRRVPMDTGNHAIIDRGEEVGTKRFTGIGTGGTAITLPCECKEVLIICDEGANAWNLTGTITGAADACPIPAESLVIPICGASGDTPFTISAVSGTVSVSLIVMR